MKTKNIINLIIGVGLNVYSNILYSMNNETMLSIILFGLSIFYLMVTDPYDVAWTRHDYTLIYGIQDDKGVFHGWRW